eukprot:m.28935 g.28935  ORF g.28935 m.28935 type:complete len:402 (-) comp12064_c0_seq2:112-1317(-)
MGSNQSICNAAERGDVRKMKELLEWCSEKGVDPLSVRARPNPGRMRAPEPGTTALHIAAVNSDIEMVQLLLDFGVDLSVRDAHGQTALFSALEMSPDFPVFELLVKAGCDVEARDNTGRTPLFVFAERNSCKRMRFQIGLGIFRLLVSSGADVNATLDSSGQTPLHVLVAGGRDANRQTLRAFIDAGANINAQDAQWNTPLHVAARSMYDSNQCGRYTYGGHMFGDSSEEDPVPEWDTSYVYELLVCGANLNAQNDEGYTPRDLCDDSSRIAFDGVVAARGMEDLGGLLSRTSMQADFSMNQSAGAFSGSFSLSVPSEHPVEASRPPVPHAQIAASGMSLASTASRPLIDRVKGIHEALGIDAPAQQLAAVIHEANVKLGLPDYGTLIAQVDAICAVVGLT